MKQLLADFKIFAMKGNVMDLAIAVVIGAAFGKIVSSLVNDMIMPLLGLVTGRVNFVDLKWVIAPQIGDTQELALRYGAFLQSIIDFLVIAFCIFMVVRLINRFKKKEVAVIVASAPPTPPKQEILLEEIRDLLRDR